MQLSAFSPFSRTPGTRPAASQQGVANRDSDGRSRWPRTAGIAESHQKQDLLMTLTTPCQVPTHSRWHLVTGTFIVTIVYVTAVAVVKWSLAA
jgi:hypothetical protein